MTKTKLKLRLDKYTDIHDDKYAGRVMGTNRKCEKKDKFHIELYLGDFKLYKNFNFDKFIVKLNYYYLVEYICAQTEICNIWDESKCGSFCWIKQTLNQMGYSVHKKSL